jgi:phosphinothricin acetyltransferase
MKIRRATRDDWPDIISIYNEAVDMRTATADTRRVTIESRQEWLEEHLSEAYPILVCELDSMVVGWCSLSIYRHGRPAFNRTVEVSYYVSGASRRMGVATNLLESTISVCRQLGYRTLVAILLDVNKPSINLLEKYGFEEWGRMPGIAEIEEEKHDHLYLGRHLTDSSE